MNRFSLLAAASLLAICTGTHAALAVDAEQLASEYHSNTAAFVQKYQGRTLSVSGPIYNLMLDSPRSNQVWSGPTLQLSGSFWRISCYLSDADAQRALSLTRGQPVTITGTFVTAGELELSLAPCTFR